MHSHRVVTAGLGFLLLTGCSSRQEAGTEPASSAATSLYGHFCETPLARLNALQRYAPDDPIRILNRREQHATGSQMLSGSTRLKAPSAVNMLDCTTVTIASDSIAPSSTLNIDFSEVFETSQERSPADYFPTISHNGNHLEFVMRNRLEQPHGLMRIENIIGRETLPFNWLEITIAHEGEPYTYSHALTRQEKRLFLTGDIDGIGGLIQRTHAKAENALKTDIDDRTRLLLQGPASFQVRLDVERSDEPPGSRSI